ncbi:hypothetical protein B0H11DRAFT_1907586 [Mycena galericulata]|nr:hypothetical protein B0H11DRAFT_1907586 [Mycena galericulata]
MPTIWGGLRPELEELQKTEEKAGLGAGLGDGVAKFGPLDLKPPGQRRSDPVSDVACAAATRVCANYKSTFNTDRGCRIFDLLAGFAHVAQAREANQDGGAYKVLGRTQDPPGFAALGPEAAVGTAHMQTSVDYQRCRLVLEGYKCGLS